jgi:hypothetical protein
MGTDIHMVIEANFDGKWVGLCEPDHTIPALFDAQGNRYADISSRHYRLFHHLAEVRSWSEWGQSLIGPPRGFPKDYSDMAYYYLIDPNQGFGYHSASWATLEEFIKAYNLAREDHAKAQKETKYQPVDDKYLLGQMNSRLRYYRRPVRILFAFDS